MARTKTKKVTINSEKLRKLIKTKRVTIEYLGPAVGYNEKTISRGLKDGQMSASLVMLIALVLRVDPNEFAYWKEYCESFSY